MINKILDYQTLDIEISKIEKELSRNNSKKTANNMRSYVKDAQEKIITLDKTCAILVADYDAIEENYLKALKQVDVIDNNQSKLSDENKKKYANQIDNISKVLENYEKKLAMFQTKIDAILNDFKIIKQKIYVAKMKYKEATEDYKKVLGEIQPDLKKKKDELKTLEKTISKQLLIKYKALKQDKISPAFVSEVDGTCGGCGFKLSGSTLAKLKEAQVLECEHCRRIIYSK